jgi:hypothetical protein
MTPEELRAIMAYLRERVHLGSNEAKDPVTIAFHGPIEDEMIGAGLNAKGVKQILSAPWWEEMIADIIETPEYCDPSDSPQLVLGYAKDVVSDYVRKRFPLNGE